MSIYKKLTAAYATRVLIITLDWSLSMLAFVAALLIHHNFNLAHPDIDLYRLLPVLGGITLVNLAFFKVFRTYSGILRFTGEQDIKRIFFASSLSFVIILLASIFHFVERLDAVLSPALAIIHFLLAVSKQIGYRVAMRIIYSNMRRVRQRSENVAIFGAGQLGMITKKSIDNDNRSTFNVVAFFDDNIMVTRKLIEGVKIWQPDQSFEEVVKKYQVKKAIIAINNLDNERRKLFVDRCIAANITPMKVPTVDKWLNGEFQADQIRKIRVEDLLNRPPIVLDKDNISRELKGQTILVSGAAGSIGSEMCRQIIKYAPKRLVMVDQAESPLVELDLALREAKIQIEHLNPIVADISDAQRMHRVFEDFRPQIVFHAAAYKHVPMMEANPEEAIRVNVMGTKNMADLSVAFGVSKFVMVSTDKAVNPTNVMGASKRIAEIYTQALGCDKYRNPHTNFITTRFGNVLGSNGSVVPRFRKQIEAGGPITVTHPDITRYFMTIPEACQLVLEAGCMGQGGEIFLFDMGKPVKILDLAKNMIKLHGLKEGQDIDIEFTGLRPGEKLYEELLANAENTSPTHNPSIMIANVRPQVYQQANADISQLISMIRKEDDMSVVGKMKEIVPEFVSNSSRYEALDKRKTVATN